MKPPVPVQFKRLFMAQLVLWIIAMLLSWYFEGLIGLFSALYGGGICFFSSWLFMKIMFWFRGAQQAKKIVQAFYIGEALKLFVSGICFALVFINFQVRPVAFFLSYILVQSAIWVAPWLIEK